MMRKKPIENPLIDHLKYSLQDAFKKRNIPLLNDICQTIMEMIKHGEDFRRYNQHIELSQVVFEIQKLTALYSQALKLISRCKQPPITILAGKNCF